MKDGNFLQHLNFANITKWPSCKGNTPDDTVKEDQGATPGEGATPGDMVNEYQGTTSGDMMVD